MYGRAPSKVNPEVISAALSGYDKGSHPISERPADHIKPEIETAKAAVSDITDDIDDVLIYALYPTTGMKFLRIKHGLDPVPEEMKANLADKPNNLSTLTGLSRPAKSASVKAFNVFIDDSYFKVEVDPTDGSSFTTAGVSSNERSPENNTSPEKSELSPGNGTLSSPMPGILLHYIVEVGQRVEVGDPIAVLEAMKMENTLPSPIGGTVESLSVEPGATVVKGEVLAIISPQ
jgi:biotin carboxyl carrier protein